MANTDIDKYKCKNAVQLSRVFSEVKGLDCVVTLRREKASCKLKLDKHGENCVAVCVYVWAHTLTDEYTHCSRHALNHPDL